MKKQRTRVLEFLRTNLAIDGVDAWEQLHIMHLPSPIRELRKRGVRIQSDRVSQKGKNEAGEEIEILHFTRYWLESTDADLEKLGLLDPTSGRVIDGS